MAASAGVTKIRKEINSHHQRASELNYDESMHWNGVELGGKERKKKKPLKAEMVKLPSYKF